jgi:UDP-galactopyranose mutase
MTKMILIIIIIVVGGGGFGAVSSQRAKTLVQNFALYQQRSPIHQSCYSQLTLRALNTLS